MVDRGGIACNLPQCVHELVVEASRIESSCHISLIR